MIKFNKEFEDLLKELDSPEIEYQELDCNQIKDNINLYSNEKLCEMIACNRYLNLHQDITIICMEELAIRRSKGDNFEFESYINQIQNTFPEIKQMDNIQNIIQQLLTRNK